MSRTESMIEQWCASWTAHDMPRLTALFTPDAVYEDVAMGVVNHGPQELTRFGEAFFNAMPDVRFEIVSTVGDETRGAAEWRMIGTHTGEMPGLPAPNGGTCDLRGISAFEVQDGKFVRCSDYWNMADFLRQLGHTD